MALKPGSIVLFYLENLDHYGQLDLPINSESFGVIHDYSLNPFTEYDWCVRVYPSNDDLMFRTSELVEWTL